MLAENHDYPLRFLRKINRTIATTAPVAPRPITKVSKFGGVPVVVFVGRVVVVVDEVAVVVVGVSSGSIR